MFSIRIFKSMVAECRHKLLNFFRSQIRSHLNNFFTLHDFQSSRLSQHHNFILIFAFFRVVKTSTIIHTLSRVVLHCLRPRNDVVYPFTTFPTHKLSHIHTHKLSLSLSHILTNTHPHTHTLSLTHTHILTNAHPHSLSHKHTHKHSHTRIHLLT